MAVAGKASRIQVSSAATVADLPTGGAVSRYTWAFTVPTRGIIRRITLFLTDSASMNGGTVAEISAFFLHTACAAGAGKDTPVASEVTSVIAQYGWSMEKSAIFGSNLRFTASPSNAYSFAASLSAPQMSGGTGGQDWDAQDSNNEVYYDLSGTTKGPVAGTGTIFVTMSGPATNGFNYTAVDTASVTLVIEPCT